MILMLGWRLAQIETDVAQEPEVEATTKKRSPFFPRDGILRVIKRRGWAARLELFDSVRNGYRSAQCLQLIFMMTMPPAHSLRELLRCLSFVWLRLLMRKALQRDSLAT